MQVVKADQQRSADFLHSAQPNALVPVVPYQPEQAVAEELGDQADVLPVGANVLEMV
jgi:hypothetical protein